MTTKCMKRVEWVSGIVVSSECSCLLELALLLECCYEHLVNYMTSDRLVQLCLMSSLAYLPVQYNQARAIRSATHLHAVAFPFAFMSRLTIAMSEQSTTRFSV